ncbi:MAG: CRTAC1 family protein, partial [Planctomycetota bacterium]
MDIDHDGDVDLLGVGDRGLHLWRHDGAEGLLGVALGPDAEAGGWTPASEQFGPVASRDLRWVVTEDFDTDGDVDLLAGGPGGALWLSSDRNERWSDRSAALPSDFDASRPPVVDDFDANGFADLWEPATGRLLGDSYGDGFELAASLDPVPSGSDPKSLDLDLDGVVDLVWLADGTLHALLAPGFEARTPWSYADTRIPERGPFVLDDVEREGRWEFHTASGTVRFGGPSGVRLGLRGLKDNPRGIGAVVHVRSGRGYRRIYYRGEPVLVGTGPAGSANVIRVVWPNGVVQSQLDAPDGQRRVLVQIEGLVGSCPFLYTWNGETFEFISDVIGITPLGLPMAPGILVPPDHDEYVLVSGEQLVSKEDGSLVLQFTEELREVTYLDAVELVAVDHPVGTEVFPTERFSFPPFPEAHTHLVEPTSPVLAALDDQGRDWSASLAATDGDLAEPFESYRGQWLGLATPHTLELHFDAAAVRSAERLRLLMCGWLYWTDASVNVAAARHPGYEFVPPVLQVPDGAGGWRDAGPPVGFPAGKTKTMVLDVTGMIDPEDPRIRVFSTLRLFWDSIRLATDGDDAPRRETRLAVSKAELYERGFSQPIFLGGDQRLEWFDWDRLASAPRWNQHPGDYTRF